MDRINALHLINNHNFLMVGSTTNLNGTDKDYFLKTGNLDTEDNCFTLAYNISVEDYMPQIEDFTLTVNDHNASTPITTLVYDYNIACNDLCGENETYCNASSLNLPENILLCNETSTTISANLPNMAYYIWDYEGQNIATTEEITVTENGWYYLAVGDACGNAAIDSVYVVLDDNCVWPGDFNYDNVTNYLDLLHWSAAFGQTGAIRPNASYNWEGQPCENWNGIHTDGVNYKHADADGNGIIDLNDPNAIIANYSETHGILPPPLTLVESPISLTPEVNEPAYASLTGSSNVVIDLDLRNNNNVNVVFNRLGFQIYYDFGGSILNNIQLELNEDWVGTNVKTIIKHFPQEQKIDVAIARYDGQNVTGDGYLGKMIAVIDNVALDTISASIGLGNVNGIKMLLNDDSEIPVGFSETDFDIPVLCPWKIQDDTICSNTNTFWIAVNAEEALENCIGAEFSLALPTGIQTTGNYTFGNLALNAVNNNASLLDAFIFGEYVVFSFDGSSPSGTALNGNGTLLYIELENTNAASNNFEIGVNGELTESYALGYEQICVDAGTIELETQSGSYGNVFVWNDATNLLTGNNPSITTITPINNPAAVITALDANGRFGIDGDTQCKLTRHGGCIPLTPIVGGLDATHILSILTNAITPTIEQLLAADVNEDGAVTAGDLTLVAQRSTGNICNYPTQAGQEISDWKFIPTDIFLNDVAYLNATKFNVPVPSQIMNFDAVPDGLCYNEKDFVAILKGDVTNNWNSSYAFKTGNLGEIVIDLANIATTENNIYQIPIFYDGSENINAIDLNFAFDVSQIQILDVVKTQAANDLDIEIDWNIVNENELYFMAFSLNEMTANTPLFYIEVQSLNSDISENLFGETHVYLNELETDLSFSTNNSVGIFTPSNLENSFLIYPNPAKNKAVVYVNETAKATTFNLYDIAGKKVAAYDLQAHNEQLEIDLNDIQAGLYFLEWQANDTVFGKQKIVVIK